MNTFNFCLVCSTGSQTLNLSSSICSYMQNREQRERQKRDRREGSDRLETKGQTHLFETDLAVKNDVGAVSLEVGVSFVFKQKGDVGRNVLRGLVALL